MNEYAYELLNNALNKFFMREYDQNTYRWHKKGEDIIILADGYIRGRYKYSITTNMESLKFDFYIYDKICETVVCEDIHEYLEYIDNMTLESLKWYEGE